MKSNIIRSNFTKNKKGVELALNTIVVAAIAITVLLVMIIIFSGGIGKIIDKYSGISTKVEGKADCLVIAGDASIDADGDGYHDSKTYSVTYKNDKGEKQKIECKCDFDKTKKEIHIDTSNKLCS